jgi:hypothetical protein
MATLSPDELTLVRNSLERAGHAGLYTKPQINAALQAIEDTLITRVLVAGDAGATVQQLVSTAINTATGPLVLSAAVKKALFAYWAYAKFLRDK